MKIIEYEDFNYNLAFPLIEKLLNLFKGTIIIDEVHDDYSDDERGMLD